MVASTTGEASRGEGVKAEMNVDAKEGVGVSDEEEAADSTMLLRGGTEDPLIRAATSNVGGVYIGGVGNCLDPDPDPDPL